MHWSINLFLQRFYQIFCWNVLFLGQLDDIFRKVVGGACVLPHVDQPPLFLSLATFYEPCKRTFTSNIILTSNFWKYLRDSFSRSRLEMIVFGQTGTLVLPNVIVPYSVRTSKLKTNSKSWALSLFLKESLEHVSVTVTVNLFLAANFCF